MGTQSENTGVQPLTFDDFRKNVLNDYQLAWESRQASLIGRKEVLTGKAKFGIFGDGKELAQLAMARVFREGDFRSGYYRDQTFMLATGLLSLEEFFAQLYANPDVSAEPSSAGRCMNGHFSTRLLNEDGSWKDQTRMKNSSADISPTAGQMPRLVGLALASQLVRKNDDLRQVMGLFSNNGNEVAFGTIGDASTSEGLFWESINAAGVLQIPMAVSVWDDGYGISVPNSYQTTKQSISDVLAGFSRTPDKPGYEIYTAPGWNYPALCSMYEEGISLCREQHIPVLFHITELTQPQGHSTSGSHERYKSKERLAWEEDYDCLKQMRNWILKNALAESSELDRIESEAKITAQDARSRAFQNHLRPIVSEKKDALKLIRSLASASQQSVFIESLADDLEKSTEPERREIVTSIKKILRLVINEDSEARDQLIAWLRFYEDLNNRRYDSHLYSESRESVRNLQSLPAQYSDNSPMVDGREIILANYDALLSRYPHMLIFGEDVGKIGGVNQTLAGMQEKYGEHRVFDTGIREATIIGQGIGLALRGFRPVAEIQYLDYLAYAIQIASDDLACLQYRTRGGQKAPLIISTRGHRLEGIWHSGSPMQFILGALRGMHILVPRNMTQAAGFYNSLMASDEPGLVIEPLNSYRIKEKLPINMGEYLLVPGQAEILREGSDISLVTYGSMCRIAQEACTSLQQLGIEVELIDVQSLIPFDTDGLITRSIMKTGKVVFADEDVPGGATAFMLQQVIEKQGAWKYLDAEPATLTAKDHRPAYGSDGDYFSKPQVEDIVDRIYQIMHQHDPANYPSLY